METLVSQKRRGPEWSRVGVVAGGLAVMVGGVLLGERMVSDRRDLLMSRLETEASHTVASIASLVGERARDLEADLALVGELLGNASDDRRALAEAQLVALDRANKHYLTLWLVSDDAPLLTVSGNRATGVELPVIDPAAVRAVASRAQEVPGRIVRAQVSPSGAAGEGAAALRLFARTGLGTRDTVVVLVALDALFETLQRRARLPGVDLWVVENDGAVLVDPTHDQQHREEVLALLADPPEPDGSVVVGPLPASWPFSERGRDSLLVAWRTNPAPAYRWTTAVAVPLVTATTALRELAARLVLVAGGSLIAFLVVGAGLSWVVRRERRLRERVDQLTRVDRMREQLIRAEKLSTFGQLALGVAHEIGTPIGVISIRLDQMSEQAPSAEAREKIAIMKEQIERIARIMRQLLDYARPRPAHRSRVLLGHAAERVASLIEHRLERAQLRVSIRVPADLYVYADVDQLHQVLLNLLVNAADAGRPGGNVEVSASASEGRASIEIHDDGSGISPESLPHVFDPFFTTKAPGVGTGLGLTIVKDIVDGHAGTIDIDSGEGWTTVRITWPTEPVPVSAEPGHPSSRPSSTTAGATEVTA